MREGDKREEVKANGLRGPKKKRSVMVTIVLVLVSMFTFVCQSMFTFDCAGTSLFLFVLVLVSMFTVAC